MTPAVDTMAASAPQTTSKNLPGCRLAVFATVIAAVVVLLGAFTRLADAGLGCPDWPGCYGHLTWPKSAEEIQIAENKFPHAPVAVDKTWPEMVHRYFASTIGLLIIGLVIINWRNRQDMRQPVKLAIGLLALVLLQGAFGMWTVTLKLWPQVVTAHLLGGFATLSLLWLLSLRSNFPNGWEISSTPAMGALKKLSVVAIVVIVLQIFLGGWTSSNYAALACLDFPSCHGSYWPEADFAMGFNLAQHIGPNYLGGLLESEARTAIHYTHRIGALITTLVVLVLVYKLFTSGITLFKGLALATAAVLFLQVGLGASNVLFFLPLPIAVAHNGVAALLLLTLVTVCYCVFKATPAYDNNN